MDHIGTMIRRRRRDLGLTLQQVADAVGCAKSYLSGIETGHIPNPPSRGIVRRLEKGLRFGEGQLERAADWQTTPASVKKDFHRVVHQRDQIVGLLRQAAGAGGLSRMDGREGEDEPSSGFARQEDSEAKRAANKRGRKRGAGRKGSSEDRRTPSEVSEGDEATKDSRGIAGGSSGGSSGGTYEGASGETSGRISGGTSEDGRTVGEGNSEGEENSGGAGGGTCDDSRATSGGRGVGGTLDELIRSGRLREVVNEVNVERLDLPLVRAPLINDVAAGLPSDFTDLDHPPGYADAYVEVPHVADVDGDSFATRIVGDSMKPSYEAGDIVVFSTVRDAVSGSDCFVRLEPDHQMTFKRVFFEADGRIRLEPLNRAYPVRVYEREEVAAIYPAIFKMKMISGPVV